MKVWINPTFWMVITSIDTSTKYRIMKLKFFFIAVIVGLSSYAEKMHGVYIENEEGWRYISQWRNWHNSILQHLLKWDGGVPDKKLFIPEHFSSSVENAIQSGYSSIGHLKNALKSLDEIRRKGNAGVPYSDRISEDYRLLRYGVHTMKLMTFMVSYHEALRSNDTKQANIAWQNIQQVSNVMDTYWVPNGFESPPKVGITNKDALTRIQLKELIQKCKQFRNDNNLPLFPINQSFTEY